MNGNEWMNVSRYGQRTVHVSGPDCTVVAVEGAGTLSVIRPPEIYFAIFTACDEKISFPIESAE